MRFQLTVLKHHNGDVWACAWCLCVLIFLERGEHISAGLTEVCGEFAACCQLCMLKAFCLLMLANEDIERIEARTLECFAD